jgi:hypothetical protein
VPFTGANIRLKLVKVLVSKNDADAVLAKPKAILMRPSVVKLVYIDQNGAALSRAYPPD